MNFKKKANGSWTNAPHYIHKTDTDTITALPAVIHPTGATATVGLKGQTLQSSIPSPTSPVMPQGTGEKTGNLFDEQYPNISGTIRYIPLYVGEGSFTLSTTTPYDSSVANLFLLSGNVSTGASMAGNGAWLNHNVTAQSDGGYITIAYRRYTGTTSPAECKTMLNTGSTAIPYEPYGYKIPISSASTTTPVYLGEVESTRRIKKWVLDGTEGWIKTRNEKYYINASTGCPTDYLKQKITTSICSHYQSQNNTASGSNEVEAGHFCFYTGGGFELYISETTISSAADFKTYLQQQYANGTPVTVWYVLRSETTGIVNEPLMKIGNYADSISGISIPTTAGANTLDVQTTLKPSEVTATFNGWHPVADVHERTNGAWT